MAVPPVEIRPAAPWARYFAPALIGALVLDLVTKAWLFPPWRGAPSWIEPHWNTGVAWSMFAEHPGFVAVLTALLIPVLAVIWWRSYRLAGAWNNLAFGLILGGALGNGYDRLLAVLGHWPGVRDFIHVDLRIVGIPYIWPTFNIADSAITVGFAILLVRSFARPAARSAAVAS